MKPICLLLLFTVQAYAQTDKTSSTQQVLVNGRQTDVEAGREATAGKIVGKQRGERRAERGMKKYYGLVAAAMLLSFSASAQMIPTTKKRVSATLYRNSC